MSDPLFDPGWKKLDPTETHLKIEAWAAKNGQPQEIDEYAEWLLDIAFTDQTEADMPPEIRAAASRHASRAVELPLNKDKRLAMSWPRGYEMPNGRKLVELRAFLGLPPVSRSGWPESLASAS